MSIYDNYVFRAQEPVEAGVRRIAKTQLTGAVRTANGKKPTADQVHEMRKRCKALRGLFRVVRPVLEDDAVFKRDNKRVRKAARILSKARDRQVSLDLCESLIAEPPGEDVGAAAAAVRTRLLGEAEGSQASEAGRKEALAKAAGILKEVRGDLGDWRLRKKGYAAIGPGVEKSYGRGRETLGRAMADPQTDALHSLRKRVKDHGYHLRLLMPVWRPVMKARYDQVDRLADLIGKDHDIAVLMDLAGAEHGDAHMDAAVHYFREWRTVLQRDALRTAGRLYAESPAAFRKRIGRYWNAWQAEGG